MTGFQGIAVSPSYPDIHAIVWPLADIGNCLVLFHHSVAQLNSNKFHQSIYSKSSQSENRNFSTTCLSQIMSNPWLKSLTMSKVRFDNCAMLPRHHRLTRLLSGEQALYCIYAGDPTLAEGWASTGDWASFGGSASTGLWASGLISTPKYSCLLKRRKIYIESKPLTLFGKISRMAGLQIHQFPLQC